MGRYKDVYNKDSLGYGEMATVKIKFNKKTLDSSNVKRLFKGRMNSHEHLLKKIRTK